MERRENLFIVGRVLCILVSYVIVRTHMGTYQEELFSFLHYVIMLKGCYDIIKILKIKVAR